MFFCYVVVVGDFFYYVMVGVVGVEIYLCIDGYWVFLQLLFDYVYVFDKDVLIYCGEKVQVVDVVVDGDLVGCLLLFFGGDQFVDVLIGCVCLLFQLGDGYGLCVIVFQQ